MALEARPSTRFISCPGCEVPAEITDHFTLPSTHGPVGHVVLHCAVGHHFRMPSGLLPRERLQVPESALGQPAAPR